MKWIRITLSFSLIWSMTVCLHGTRLSTFHSMNQSSSTQMLILPSLRVGSPLFKYLFLFFIHLSSIYCIDIVLKKALKMLNHTPIKDLLSAHNSSSQCQQDLACHPSCSAESNFSAALSMF